MNLRQRGITVGDLLISTILIGAITLLINKITEEKKQTLLNNLERETISIKI